MACLWHTLFAFLCVFAFAVARHDDHDDDDDDDDDVRERLGRLQNHWARMQRTSREWEMFYFKMWLTSNVHRRFIFNSTQTNNMRLHLQAFLHAQTSNMTQATRELLRRLQASGAPQTDVANFMRGFRTRCEFPSSVRPPSNLPKSFFVVTTRANYSGGLSACHAKGGSLAVLSSSNEAQTAWKAISGHQHMRFYVMAKTLPERYRRMYPQLLGNEMDSPSGPNVKCLSLNPTTINRFVIENCNNKQGALCEKYDLVSPVKSIGVKGFVYYKNRETLQQAKKTCASIGGSLATIENKLEQIEALDHLRFHGNVDAFIGAYKDSKYEWLWSGMKKMHYKNWGHYDQVNMGCAVMESAGGRKTGQWRPVSCSSKNAFLCSVRVIPDSFVRLVDRNAMGKYFVGHSDRRTHSEARSKCGQLAKIRNKEQLAAAMAAARHIGRVHIGLRDYASGKFMWGDESRVEPDMEESRMVGFGLRDSNHRCVVMDEHGRWLTTSCDEKAGYLCEEIYQKKPTKEDGTPGSFDMDVSYDIPFAVVKRTTKDMEAFIKAAEAPITKITGKTVTVSALKAGSTIVTYRFYTGDMDKTFNEVKAAVTAGRVLVVFNGQNIRTTAKQDFNYNTFMIGCWSPDGREHRFGFIIGAAIGVLVFVTLTIVTLVCCIKKRQALTARVAATVAMKPPGDLEKKMPLPDDDPLPPYKEAVAEDQPPPYYLPVASPPPPYNSAMPEVKT